MRFTRRVDASLSLGRVKSRTMPVKKLSKEERLVDEQMLALLEWSSEHPDKWHRIGKLPATVKAAQLLAQRDVLEIWPETKRRE
jgi:hypothetical protein